MFCDIQIAIKSQQLTLWCDNLTFDTRSFNVNVCVSIKVFCAAGAMRWIKFGQCFKNNSWCPGAEDGPGVFAESGQYTGRSGWPASLTAGSQLSLLAAGQHMACTSLTQP